MGRLHSASNAYSSWLQMESVVDHQTEEEFLDTGKSDGQKHRGRWTELFNFTETTTI